MSGRQQHYIPQLLQRNFAFKQSGDEFHVYVYRKGSAKAFAANTRGVGQQRDFYGNPESPETDDAITGTESHLAEILRALNGRAPGSVSSRNIGLLIAALSMRTKAMRQTLEELVPAVLTAAKACIPDKAASRTLLQDYFNDKKQRDEAIDRELRNHPEWNHRQRRRARKFVQSQWKSEYRKNEHQYVSEFAILLAQGVERLKASAAAVGNRAFLQALSRDPNMLERAARFADFEFGVLNTNAEEPFILGDCVAFAIYTDGEARLALADLDDEVRIQGLVLPVSPTRCVVGRTLDNNCEVSVGEINRMSASLSLELFISNMPECDSVRLLHNLIGTSVRYSTDELLIRLLNESE